MSTVNQNFRLLEDIAIASAAYRAVDRVERAFDAIRTTVADWAQRERNRHYLAQMDDRLLRDIGLSRFDVEVETNKYFWQK